jgi:hypothetical protein
MKFFTFLLLLMPLYAEAAVPELVCSPEAHITFESRWVRGSVLKLGVGEHSWELPWTGRETTVSGMDLRGDRRKELPSPEAAESDELINVVPDVSRFYVYREKPQAQSPLVTEVFVDRALLRGVESDGLVIVQHHQRLEILEKPSTKVSVYRCRSR